MAKAAPSRLKPYSQKKMSLEDARTQMLSYPIEIAKRKGLEGFTAWFLASNTRMVHVFKKSRCPLKYSVDGDLYHLTLDLTIDIQKRMEGWAERDELV